MARYTAAVIADWFIFHNEIYIDMKGAEMLSNLKLQKLLYYAQGVVLAITGCPLFDEAILKERHGPVVASQFARFSDFGNGGIDFHKAPITCEIIDYDTSYILREVFKVFGVYSAYALTDIFMEEEFAKDIGLNEEIPILKMKEFFEQEYIEE